MNKKEILQRIDSMIANEQAHIDWLKTQRKGKIGNFFFPSINPMIDIYLIKHNNCIEELKKSKTEYENSNFDLF